MNVRDWFLMPCGCEASRDALIVVEGCRVHRSLCPEDALFLQGSYGPIDLPAAVGA